MGILPNQAKAKILIVEDDPQIARIVLDHLRREDFECTWASTGLEGWEEFRRMKPDLAVVDIMLPEMDGFDLCRNIRLASDVPLLLMSAKQEDQAKVEGLELGADDYITKPFSLTEMTARIKSHLRRFRRYQHPDHVNKEQVWSYEGGLTLDIAKRQAVMEGRTLELTSKEWSLLHLLAAHPERLFTKKELYEHVWQQTDAEGNNTVTVHIKSLRGKLKEDPRDPRLIQTVWGSGYRFIGVKLP
ncbi:response regulator transcription factor [Paenibacillus azoreducens]|uniref:DNA-binding response regulator n=1 Tax=Paenibacillus azoreducens TaxID=116718 RepID=A0A919YAC3_9BACL|nr:response regulator transcription factor [Paenibacillus azoreducens]GIO47901.1 DNA-binding response regulator [Paenibacillus azoreducens]